MENTMSINQIDASLFPDLKRSKVYQITSGAVSSGVFYVALDPVREVANVYCLDEDEKPDSVAYSALFLKTLADAKIDESEVLIINGKDQIYQAMRDWSGLDADLLFSYVDWDDQDLNYDDSLSSAASHFQNNDLYKYLVDPYADEQEQVVSMEEIPTNDAGQEPDYSEFDEEPVPEEEIPQDSGEEETPL